MYTRKRIFGKNNKKILLSRTCILILSFPTCGSVINIPIENLQKKMNLRKVHIGVVYIANNCIYTGQLLPTSNNKNLIYQRKKIPDRIYKIHKCKMDRERSMGTKKMA